MYKPRSKTKEPSNEAKAYEYAVFLLSLQLRTVGEIREKMIGRGYTSAIIENVLNQFHDNKYLDDERYAQVFLENLKVYKNLGYYGIKKKFMMKKLPPDIISKVLDDGLSLADELKIAKRFLKKEGIVAKASGDEESSENSYNTFDEEKSKQKQKLSAKLKSRGFRGDVIAKLLR
jgi:SOS response regulatory protein OraA/RecX